MELNHRIGFKCYIECIGKWANSNGFQIKELEYLEGDEAGIKSVTALVIGENAYGYLKGEMGVHRLVRISPFDSGGRRHTSFASVEVLPEITDAVKGQIKILVDGGIRSGADILKALAIGADGVVIARTFVIAAYGGGEEGVKSYAAQLGAELEDAMTMCGVHSLKEITRDIVRL